MSIAHLLEDFGALRQPGDAVSDDADPLGEDGKLEAFEQGYKAGWDDAVAAHDDAQRKIRDDLARNLRDLSFTYHEALNAMSTALRPLISEIVNVALPKMAHDTLGLRIAEEIEARASGQINLDIRIAVSPENAEAVERLLGEDRKLPVHVTADPSIGAGQAQMRLGGQETQIDLDEMIENLSQAVAGYFHDIERKVEHA